MKASRIKTQLAMTTALAAALFGYGRRAYASCDVQISPNYLCSSAETTVQSVTADNANVYTDGTFSITGSAGNGIMVTGDGALSFTDTNNVYIGVNGSAGIRLYATGDDAGLPAAGSITINSNSNINAPSIVAAGIGTENRGSGSTSVTFSGQINTGGIGILSDDYGSGLYIGLASGGSITTTNGNGITARAHTDGTLQVAVDGDIHSHGTGILAHNYGTGATQVTVSGTVYSADQRGILAVTDASTTDVSITVQTGGYVGAKYDDGIRVNHSGSGTASIKVQSGGEVYSGSNSAVALINYNGSDASIVTEQGSILSGATLGIALINYMATAAASITVNGSVDGVAYGIALKNYGTDATINAQDYSQITSAGVGIAVLQGGSGKIDITVNNEVTSTGNSLQAGNVSGTDTYITTDTNSKLTSTAGSGIFAQQQASGTLDITANGEIDAYVDGIYAYNTNGSYLHITTGGISKISSSNGIGINAINKGVGDLYIDVGYMVDGKTHGISAKTSTRDLTVKVEQGASVTASNGTGIYTYNNGIRATDIYVYGAVSGTGGQGIYAINTGNTGNLRITTGQYSSITSDSIGIQATNTGTSSVGMYIDGYVSGSATAIKAMTTGAGSVFVLADDDSNIVSSSGHAIYARNYSGGGSAYVTVRNKVTAQDSGIYVRNFGTNLNVNAQTGSDITSYTGNGIRTFNYGTGQTYINVDGTIDAYINGIYVYEGGSDGDITLQTGKYSSITSQSNGGIHIFNQSLSGSTQVTLNGYVSGYQDGISIWDYSAGQTNLTIGSYGDVRSTNGDAIRIQNDSGKLVVETEAGSNVSTSDLSSVGINIRNTGSDTVDLTVKGSVSGENGGIAVHNDTTGGNITLTVDSTGYVAAPNGAGVWVDNYSTTGGGINFTLNSGGYISATYGDAISLHRYGISTISATISGDTYSYEAGLSISTGTAGDIIVAVNKGASITSTSGEGLHIWNTAISPSSSIMSITVNGDISSYNSGVSVRNSKFAGGVTIQTGQYSSIISSSDPAIDVENHAGDLSMTLAGAMSGYSFGVRTVVAPGTSSANTVLTGTSSITSPNMGLLEINYSSVAFNVTIDSGASIYGGQFGIAAVGTGGQINTSGDISTGASGYAVIFANLADDTTLNIYGGHIVGDVAEIDVYSGPMSSGYSHVNIAGNFESEGDFYVSDFNVNSGAVFTLGKGFTVSSIDDPIDIYGTFLIPEDPLITGDVDVHTGGLLDVHDVTTITGFLKNDGTVSIAHDGSVDADTMQAGTGTMYFGVDSVSDHGLLTISSGAADLTNQTIKILVGTGATFSSSDQIKIIDGASTLVGGPGSTPVDVWEDTPAWDFKIVDGTGISNDSDLYLVLTANAPPPSLDGAIAAATLTLADNALNMTSERLSDLRGGERGGMTGISAGGASTGNRRIWTQALGQYIHQGERQGIPGYTAQLMGGTIGVDTDKYLKNGILGLAFSYGQSRIDAMNTTTTAIDIDSYQLTLYGDYNWPQGWYMTGMAAYSFNLNDSTRHNAGGAGINADASFNSQQAALRGEVGRTYDVGQAYFTPFTVANWVYYTAQDYTETGAGSGNLHVDSKDMHQIDLGIGGKTGINFYTDQGDLIRPEIHAVYRRDLLGNNLSTTQTYVGSGAPSFTVQSPNPARNKFTLGTQLKYYAADGLEMTAAYDLELKEDYVSHTGLLRAGWQF